MTEPKRPMPADGATYTGLDYSRLTPDEFEKAEAELREAIRNRSKGDFQ